MKKTLFALLMVSLAGAVAAQDIEHRMSEKTSKKAYNGPCFSTAT